MKITAFLMIGILALLCSCGGGGSSTGGGSSNPIVNPPPTQSNPTPSISSLSPNSTTAGSAAFTLTVNGSNFVSSSALQWNGATRQTTFVSATQLHAAISAADIASAGTVQVTVSNPTPGGGTSNAAIFTIQSAQAKSSNEFGYVANISCLSTGMGCVYVYAIDANTGVMSQVGTAVNAGNGSEVLTSDPLGKFLYIANALSSDISMFSIDPKTGRITALSPGTVPGGAPEWIGIHPSGKFAYLANDNDTSIDVFAIDPSSGELTETSSAPACINSVRTPGVFEGLDPGGKFAYVAQGCSFGNILTFSIDQSTGALVQTSAANTIVVPVALAVHPSGNFIYAVGGSEVDLYNVNLLTGGLTFANRIATGSLPSAIAINPGGKFVYVANSGSNDISEYNIDQSSGALAELGTVGVNNNPISLAIEQSGKFLYALNASDAGCSFSLGGSVQGFSIGATGTLTPIGTKVCAGVMATQIVTVRPTGAAEAVNLTGTWQGSWASSDGPSGSLTSAFTQNGSALGGTTTITNSPCVATLAVSGSVTGTTVLFGTVSSGGNQSGFSGTLNTDDRHMSGTYAGISGPCAKDTGTWSLDKQ